MDCHGRLPVLTHTPALPYVCLHGVSTHMPARGVIDHGAGADGVGAVSSHAVVRSAAGYEDTSKRLHLFQPTRRAGRGRSTASSRPRRSCSTHAPVRSASRLYRQRLLALQVPTHALVRSATAPWKHVPTDNQFQPTRVRGARHGMGGSDEVRRSPVNVARAEVLEQCRRASGEPQGSSASQCRPEGARRYPQWRSPCVTRRSTT